MARDHQQTYDADHDVIVIGSGIGGLAAASVLAQVGGRRVLVLERHFKLGGFTHTFKRPPGYVWDPGLHYVGDMDEGRPSRRIFDLVTAGGVAWRRLPHHYDRFVYPDLDVRVPGDPQEYRDVLVDLFPSERDGIDGWFRDVKHANHALPALLAGRQAPGPLDDVLEADALRYVRATVDEVLDQHTRDPVLRAVLTSQWGDLGLPPSRASFVMHAAVVAHYLHGGFYPDQGAQRIAETVAPIIEAAGGACLVDHEVTRILVDDARRAVGVEVATRNGEVQLRAPVVISDAGAALTYGHLLPDLGLPAQAWATPERSSLSSVTLFLGLSDDPRRHLDTEGENHWMYATYDHDANYADRNSSLDGSPTGAFVSFTSLRAGLQPHTAQVISFADAEAFQPWAGERWKRRGDDYEELKGRLGEGLLAFADERLPGLADLVDYAEVSTPLSVTDLASHPRGAIYGVAATPENLSSAHLGSRSPVAGLHLAGADASTVGIVSAMMGGVMAAAEVLGDEGWPRILGAVAEAPSAGAVLVMPELAPVAPAP